MPLSAPAEEPVLDPSPFHELFEDGNPEGTAWMVSYIETATRALEDMHRALGAGDRTALVVSAHRIGGTSLVVGARRIGVLCQSIELDAPWKPAEELSAMVDEADKEFDEVRKAITRFVARG